MTYLVCTQMRVCQVEGSLPYLTSSCETETFITGLHSCNNVLYRHVVMVLVTVVGTKLCIIWLDNRLPQRSAICEWPQSEELHPVDQNSEGQRCPAEDSCWWSLLLPSAPAEIHPTNGRCLRWEEKHTVVQLNALSVFRTNSHALVFLAGFISECSH